MKTDQAMTHNEAMRLSRDMALPLFPVVKRAIANDLFDHYRTVLASRALPIVPTTRRLG
jgi:hypothetical protein